MMSDEQVLVIPARALIDLGGLEGFSNDIPRFQSLLTRGQARVSAAIGSGN